MREQIEDKNDSKYIGGGDSFNIDDEESINLNSMIDWSRTEGDNSFRQGAGD